MPADWYCEIDGQQQGPITSLQLKQLATAGKLQPSHPVWKEGMQKKVPAQTVKGLFDGPSEPARRPATALAAPKKEGELVNLEMLSPAPSKGGELIELETIDTVEEVEEVEELEEVRPRKKKRDDEDEEEDDRPRKKRKSDEEDEDVEEDERPRKKKKRDRDDDGPAAEVLAEVPITYREGHPDLEGPIEGMLTVESTGLRFQFEEDDEFRVAFDKFESLMEPAKGDFPPSMKKKAMAKKIGGKVGKLAAGLMGKWLGSDSVAGKLVDKVGSAAGDATAKSGDLGKPPRNRLTFFAQLRKKRCKVIFDVGGDDRDEMTQEAKVIYKQIQKARDKFTTALANEGETNINIVINEAPGEAPEAPPEKEKAAATHAAPSGGRAYAAPPTAGKPFRIMSGGQVRGPFSLEEIRRLLSSGKIGGGDLIGVETWLPAATLGGLVGAGSSALSRGGAPAHGGGTSHGSEEAEGGEDEEEQDEDASEEEYGDFEEVTDDEDSDQDEEEEEASASAAADGDGRRLPVDDEFNIG